MLVLASCTGCSSHEPVRHLSADACLIVPKLSTRQEVISFLGMPDERRKAPDNSEIWYYFQPSKSFWRKTPLIGKKMGEENYDLVTVTFVATGYPPVYTGNSPKKNLKNREYRPLHRNKINNFAKARSRMVQEQLVPRGITDPAVLKAMEAVPRHLFVEDALQAQAYGDYPLPIGEGQTISQPYIVALMTQFLHLTGQERVLEIGTGCGYQSAVLAAICKQVYTIERIKSLLSQARLQFDRLHLFNILSKADDGTEGWQEHAPFDAIIVTAAGPHIPEPLLAQLADPGILVIPVGDRMSQILTQVEKKNGKIISRAVEAVRFVSLIGAHGWKDE